MVYCHLKRKDNDYLLKLFYKMPSLDGCGGSEIALILQSKPNLDGIKGFCTKFVRRTCTQFSALLTKS